MILGDMKTYQNFQQKDVRFDSDENGLKFLVFVKFFQKTLHFLFNYKLTANYSIIYGTQLNCILLCILNVQKSLLALLSVWFFNAQFRMQLQH